MKRSQPHLPKILADAHRKCLCLLIFCFAARSGAGESDPLDFGADTLKIQADWTKCIAAGGSSSTFAVHCRIRMEQAWEVELQRLYEVSKTETDSSGRSAIEDYEKDWMRFRRRGFEFCAATYLSDKFETDGKIQNLECRIALIRHHAVKFWRATESSR